MEPAAPSGARSDAPGDAAAGERREPPSREDRAQVDIETFPSGATHEEAKREGHEEAKREGHEEAKREGHEEAKREGAKPAPLGPRTARAIALDPRLASVFSGDGWMQRSARAADTVSLGELAGYRLVRVVARGSQGTVYEALEPRTSRRVAIKRLPNADAGAAERARFLRETEALAGLAHPNIVALLSAPEDDGARLIVMEWIDGAPLDDWADRAWSRLAPREALRVIVVALRKAADAVAAAHARGTIHRDLKPSNVLVTGADEPKVLDFGLAKPLGSRHESSIGAGFAGTPAWASPEQVAGRARDIDARSDVHALGLLLYRALAGRTAFDGDAPIAELFESIRRTTPALPSRFRGGVPRELDLVAMRALEKDPSRRYQTAEALARDLDRFLAGEPVEAHPPSAGYLASKFVRRHRALTAVGTVAAVAIVAGAVVSLRLAHDAKTSRDDAILRATEADRARLRAERMNGFFQDLLANLREREAAGERSSAREIIALAVAALEKSSMSRDSEAELRTTLGVALLEIGEHAGALRQLKLATELLAAQDDRAELARVLCIQSLAASRAGVANEGADAARHAIEVLATIPGDGLSRMAAGPSIASTAHERLAYALVSLNTPTPAVAEADIAIRSATEAGDQLGIANALSTKSLALQLAGEIDDALPLALEAAGIARTLPAVKPMERARLLHNAAFLLNEKSRAQEALPLIDESLAIREAHFGKSHPALTAARTQLSTALRTLGRHDEAIAVCEQSIDALGGEDPQQLRLRASAMRHLARSLEIRGQTADSPRILACYRDSARLQVRSGFDNQTVLLSSTKFLYRAILARDGVDALLAEMRALPAELASLASDPSIEAIARCEAAHALVRAKDAPRRTPDAETVRAFRRDLATIQAHRDASSTEALRVRLGLAAILSLSASAAERAESRALAEGALEQIRAIAGERSELARTAQALAEVPTR